MGFSNLGIAEVIKVRRICTMKEKYPFFIFCYAKSVNDIAIGTNEEMAWWRVRRSHPAATLPLSRLKDIGGLNSEDGGEERAFTRGLW